MSLEDILTRIKADGAAEAQKILKNANNEITTIRNEYGQKLVAKESVERRSHESRIAELRNVHLAQAHRRERQIKLLAKEEMINLCFSELRKRLTMLVDEKYILSLKALFEEGVELIEGNIRVRAVRQGDLEHLRKFADELSNDRSGAIKVTEDLLHSDHIGGLQLESEDGNKIIDNTFSAILERNRELYRIEISKILFG